MALMNRVTGLARCSMLIVLVVVLVNVNVAPAEAQDRVSAVSATTAAAQPSSETPQTRPWLYTVHGGVYSADGFGFLGGGVTVPVAQRFWFTPSGEWLFVRNIDRMFTLNADLRYDVPVDGSVLPWVGAGIGVRHFAKGDGWRPEHSLGFNLTGGLGFPQLGGMIPFVQGKVFLAGDTLFANTAEFVMSAGLRF